MNQQQKEWILAELRDRPATEWDEFLAAQNLRASDYSELGKEADRLSESYARLSGYFDHRGGMGCGDCGHDEANQEGIKKASKVRKALGYFS